MNENYDVIIIGSGPSGMTAGIYALRAGLSVLVFEKMAVGGQTALTQKIENYPGFSEISGFDLAENMYNQLVMLGGKVVFKEVESIVIKDGVKSVLAGGLTYNASAIILSMGASSRPLGTNEDKKFLGKGLSYCAVCDGAFFRDKVVAVVGGGNSALQDIEYLSGIAKEIIHINRRAEFRADAVNTENYLKLLQSQKIKQFFGFVIEKLEGEDKLKSIVIKNIKTNEKLIIDVDGLFVAIGRVPQTEIIQGVKLDEFGYIEVDKDMKTNLEGIFACGDITSKTLRQISTAVGDGAIAGTSASVYVKKLKKGM